MSQDEQRERDKAVKFAKKELKKLGKAGKAEIKRMEEEEKVRMRTRTWDTTFLRGDDSASHHSIFYDC